MRVSIHQPNFLPWIGLFHRIYLSECFVIFDHVQAMGGKSWLSRNRILIGGQKRWITMPVRKTGRFGQRINEVEINYETNFLEKHLRTLELNYKKAKFFDEFFPILEKVYTKRTKYISHFNSLFIMEVTKFLGLERVFIHSSDLLETYPDLDLLKGNELILEICRKIEATQYISGTGCLDFINPKSFQKIGIEFYFQNFVHPNYSQHKAIDFVSHLSIIDALFSVGKAETLQMVSQPGVQKP